VRFLRRQRGWGGWGEGAFVDDTVRGFLAAADASNVEGETIQLGTGHAVSIQELFDMACRAARATGVTVKTDPRRLRPDPSEVLVLVSDPARARERLAWSPTTSLTEGLERTVRWLERNLETYKDALHL
jgi:nucleoside-diphosphate-sugar epimerase